MADGARDDGAWVTKRSVLERVEVFRRGAEITRRLALDEGQLRVRLEALPLELDDGSVRVELAAGRALVRGFRVALDVRDAPTDPIHTEPDEIRALRRRLRAIGLELDELRAQHARAAGLAVPERPARDHGRPPPPAPDRGRLELLELRFSLQREARERSQALELEKRELERTLRTLLDRESRKTTDTPILHRVHKALELELDRADAGASLAVVYRVRSARWAPSYRLAFDSRTRRARLAMRAVIAQRTGEDWSDAALAVSTARMDGWYDLPELASLRIGRAQPAPKTGYRPLPEGGDALFADHDRVFPPQPPPPSSPAHAPVPMPPVNAPYQVPDAAMFAAPMTMALGAAAPRGPVSGGAPPPPRAAAPTRAEAAPEKRLTKAAAAPAPMAPPASMPMVPPVQTYAAQGRAKGGGLMANLLGGFGGGGGAPADLDEGGAELAEVAYEQERRGGPLEDAPPRVAPSRALLDFGALRLAAPNAPLRGVLRAAEAGSDPMASSPLVAEALAAARAVEHAIGALAAPSSHSYPDSLFGFDYRYEAEGRIEVPSDGAFHTVAITEAEGPASMLHVSVPREDPAVFRTLELASPLSGAVLRGPADIYLDGALLVSSSVSPTPTAGKLEIGMGVDESVKVARNVRFREESAGLMGGSASLVHELEIEVQNASASAIRLEVRERLPVLAKGEEDIEIRPGKTSPPWQDLVQDEPPLEGGKRWVIDVAAGQKATLAAEYAIRISAKNELVGGNRRG
jgi:hypothetical protein